MASMYSVEKASAFLERELAKKFDENDKESVQARLKNLRNLTENVRQAITDGKLVGANDFLDELLRKCNNEQTRLQASLRVSGRNSTNTSLLQNRIQIIATGIPMGCDRSTVEKLRRNSVKVMNLTSAKDGNFRVFEEKDLNQAIIDLGYKGCDNASSNTKQCLELFMQNLGNSGRPGPNLTDLNKSVFSQIVKGNKVSRTKPEELAQLYLSASSGDNTKFVTNSDTDYLKQLKDFINTKETERKSLLIWICSTANFIDYLFKYHEGNVENFVAEKSEAFEKCEDKGQFVIDLVYSLMPERSGIKGLGYALAANFIKDLFATQLKRGISIDEQRNTIAAYAVKPDMHVGRMMLVVTGRCNLDDVIFLNKFVRQYETTPVMGEWHTKGAAKPGEETIVRDVMRLAHNADCSPLEIERMFYMCGSGNFGSEIQINLEGSPHEQQILRYKTLLGEG